MKKSAQGLALGLAIAAGLTGAASAHAKLLKSDPAANAATAPKTMARLTFNEDLSAKLSGAAVTDARGRAVPGAAKTGNKAIVVTFRAPLAPGPYQMKWHAVASDDGHRTEGAYKFTVK